MKVSRNVKSRRKARGAQLTEFGPALIILFLVGLLPVIDLLGMLVSYGFGWYLNYLQGREAALTMVVRDNRVTPSSNDQVDASLADLESSWLGSGFGAFTGAQATDVNTVAVLAPLEPPSGSVTGGGGPGRRRSGNIAEVQESSSTVAPEAMVTTQVTVKPFLKIPLPVEVPGLTGPVTFRYTTRRPVEDFI